MATTYSCLSDDFDSTFAGGWSIGYNQNALYAVLDIENVGDPGSILNVQECYIVPTSIDNGIVNPISDLAFYLPPPPQDYSILDNVQGVIYDPPVNNAAIVTPTSVSYNDGYQLLNSFDLESNSSSDDKLSLVVLFAPYEPTVRTFYANIVVKYGIEGEGFLRTSIVTLTGNSFWIDKSEMDATEVPDLTFEVNGINIYNVFTIG
jgi:hypothetical protein